MRNRDLERVASIFVGEWSVSITNQRWIEEPTTTTGSALGEWLGEAFVQLRVWIEGDPAQTFGDTAPAASGGAPAMHFVFGRSDARDQFIALSHDERGTLRVWDLHLDGASWELHRADPDFHQRFVGAVDGDRIVAHPDISEDGGASWQKDYDMTFTRRPRGQ